MTQIIIEDDFLPQDVFDAILEKSMQGTINHNDTVKRYNFDVDPTPQIAQFLGKFEKHRGHNDLGRIIHTSGIPPHYQSPRHDEAEFKIMSAIICLGPEVSYGTKFYMDEEFEVEWKPNRLMVFCGETGVTWHDYRAGDEERFTYNYFLVDPTKVENETYRNTILRL